MWQVSCFLFYFIATFASGSDTGCSCSRGVVFCNVWSNQGSIGEQVYFLYFFKKEVLFLFRFFGVSYKDQRGRHSQRELHSDRNYTRKSSFFEESFEWVAKHGFLRQMFLSVRFLYFYITWFLRFTNFIYLVFLVRPAWRDMIVSWPDRAKYFLTRYTS